MCGIAGYINFNKKQKLEFSKNSLIELMKNRGPDFQDNYKLIDKEYDIEFFSSRLSIIDLKRRSNQPFKFQNFVIIFNGEIYNYIELRNKLISYGHKFSTNSDTEVLLKAYIHWGEKLVEYLDGMWAFSIYDLKKKIVFVSRDHFGQKPFFYYRDENKFIFGSEIKYIFKIASNKKIKKINYDKLKDYITIGYRSIYKNNQTFFKNIDILEPGSNLIINLNNKKIIKKLYFKERHKIVRNNFKNITKEISSKKVLELLIESMQRKTRSDVPISFSLSGGVDSCGLLYIANKILNLKTECFSIIDQDKRYNEIEKIRIVENDLGIKSNKVYLKEEKNFLSDLENLINYHDSPITTNSYYIHSKLTKSIASKNIRVNLSGTGADELFTGYYDHFLLHMMGQNSKNFKKNHNFWKTNIRPLIKNKELKNFEYFKKNFKRRKYLTNIVDEIFKDEISFKDEDYSKDLLKNRMLNELFKEVVPVILKEDDHNSMLNSIENRSPYLDLKLFNYLNNFNSDSLIKNGYSKYFLRKSLDKIVPDKILWNREKRGFNANIFTMLNISKKFIVKLVNNNLFLKNIIDTNKLNNVSKKQMISNKTLFAIINCSLFLKNFED